MITPAQLRWLGLFTLLGLGGLGLYIIWMSDGRTLLEMLEGNFSWYSQLGIGLALGTINAFAGWGLIRMPFMEPVERKYRTLIGGIRIGWPDIIFLSVCAGVGEELLFRGGVQPHFGVWPTSILFVALHGYLNPMDWRVSVYGIFMTIAIAIIGKLYLNVGALSAFTAHTMIDIILIRALIKAHQEKGGDDDEEPPDL
ncbi:MAG: CPBP family intramembrane glutamic endopeptidase [Flavobacteriales bacterium]